MNFDRNIMESKILDWFTMHFFSYLNHILTVSLLLLRFLLLEIDPNVLPPSPTFIFNTNCFSSISFAKTLASANASAASLSSFAFLNFRSFNALFVASIAKFLRNNTFLAYPLLTSTTSSFFQLILHLLIK